MSVKRGSLGKNLSALLGTNPATAVPVIKASDTSKLKLELMQPGKYQPRKAIDEASLEELAGSIKQQGLLQPIVIRPLGNQKYEIIAGERRWRACQLAGLTEAPVVIKEVDDETAMAMALVENLQREDLNPMDQSRAMGRLHHEFELTHQQIAELLSKSRTAVSNYLRLLSLAEEVMRMLEYGDLDMGHARALLILDAEQQVQVAKLVVAKSLSVRETEKLVSRIKEGKAAQPVEREIPAHTQMQIQNLAQHLRSKIKLKPGKNGKGSLIIHYDTLHDLDSVIKQIIEK
ncbi:chromosome partitioning protein parB [Legionella birminghamensis]|uniref:Probable chromosome-partitioning protein ParB n=1 Tax=Legionella birminghamensis TaxID=28083 RepID=A0A378IDE9_9GAMM|nr:ParB/RepB/Spo0J family partition protein [Legionella birminghamensis]KTC68829.1 chromosome partitioning protein parB [Legionella birminghamensis]STX33229.1 chromosome partitioning protein parB [Legionella birminghamensis]